MNIGPKTHFDTPIAPNRQSTLHQEESNIESETTKIAISNFEIKQKIGGEAYQSKELGPRMGYGKLKLKGPRLQGTGVPLKASKGRGGRMEQEGGEFLGSRLENGSEEHEEKLQPSFGLSTQYVGLGTRKVKFSSNCYQTTLCYDSTSDIKFSTQIFRSTDDILAYLKSDPDYQMMEEEELDAIVAALISGALISGGVVLIAMTGGATTPLTLLGSTLLLGSGFAGMTNAISGAIHHNFKWSEWSKDVIISAGTSLITFGASYAIAASVSSICLQHGPISLTTEIIEALAEISGGVAGAAAKGTSYAMIKQGFGDDVEFFELSMQLIEGAFIGAAVGKVAFNAQLKPLLRVDQVAGHKKGQGFTREPMIIEEARQTKVKIFYSDTPITVRDIYRIEQPLKNATPINGNILIVSGTHGNTRGQTVLDCLSQGEGLFFNQDQNALTELFSNFRDRNWKLINLADYREERAFHELLMTVQPDVVVLNFCHGRSVMEYGKLGAIIKGALNDIARRKG